MPNAYYNEIDPHAAEWLRNLIAAGHIAPGDVDERDIRDVHPDDLAGYTQCHFFAGIGVWSYALRLAGWRDDEPVWTGSCPCQPFSAAGKRAGAADERHLWPAWFHLISQCRPRVLFGEQVASKDALAWFDVVSTDLAAARYTGWVADLCAAGVGAPHIRQRLYFVADAGRNGAQLGRPDGERAPGGHEEEARERQRVRAEHTASESTCELAYDEINGRREERQNAGGLACGDRAEGQPAGSESSGGPVILGDASAAGLQARERGELCGARWREEGRAVVQPGRPFWADCDWLPCIDGKARPVEPGSFPLAYGLASSMGSDRPGEDSPFRVIKDARGRSIGQAPWRIGMLRAYGNAIVGPQAAEFIRAYVQARG